MTLSARDRRILETIENDLLMQDRAWVARFARLGEARRFGPLRRRWKLVAAVVCWIGLVSVDAVTAPATLLWITLATAAVGVPVLLWMRHHARYQSTSHVDPFRIK